jgi:hypothetical protein
MERKEQERMNAGDVKQIAREWVESNAGQWPGLRGAHLVGSITTLADPTPFPPYKDVDIHLIFEASSPMLVPHGPFAHPIETAYQGLLIEAGLKSVAEYQSAEAVLANPEIAHHLTVDSILYDPAGLLEQLRAPVRAGYPQREWVLARCACERAGLATILQLLARARAAYGAGGVLQILGYSFTRTGSLLSDALLQAPTTGSRLPLRIRTILDQYGQIALYEEMLAVLGVQQIEPQRAEQLLQEGAAAFDLAAQVKRSPHPFGHKIHAHLKPYFVQSCRSLLAEGYYREAAAWVVPFYTAATAIIMTDGPDAEKPKFAARLGRFFVDLGAETKQMLDARLAQAQVVHGKLSDLADHIVATNPAIID